MPLSAPTKFSVPFNNSGVNRTTIPVASQIGVTPGRASYTDGFPPLTMTPISSGGIPPFGQDFNGIFFAVTQAIQWLQSGAGYAYDGTFATAVGGYPQYALVQRSDGQGYWLNTVANNSTAPESSTTSGWIPAASNASSAVTMTSSNVTLTALQAGAYTITLSGALTTNLQLIFPTWAQEWLVVNNCTGAFSVTCKTASGAGVAIAAGNNAIVYGDGANINSLTSTQASVSGLHSNLVISYTGTAGAVTVTANALTLNNSAGQSVTLNAWNQTATSGNASGAANSLDAGSWAFSTWYNLFAIYNPTTQTRAHLWSLSATAPTLPSGYTYFARVGANKTQSATNYWFLGGTQLDRSFQYKVNSSGNLTALPLMSSGAQGNVSTPTWVAVAVSPFIPTTAGRIAVTIGQMTTASQALLAPSNSYGGYASTSNPPPFSMSGGSGTTPPVSTCWMTLESTSIYIATGSTSGGFYCFGWEDNL